MQNVQTAPKLCLGLPEGVLLYIEGRSLDIAKRKLQSEKPKGFSTLEEKQKVCTICFVKFHFLFAVCAIFTPQPTNSATQRLYAATGSSAAVIGLPTTI